MVKVDISRGDSPEVLQDSMLASRGESVSDVLQLIQKVSKTAHYSELITLWKPIQAKTHWANMFFSEHRNSLKNIECTAHSYSDSLKLSFSPAVNWGSFLFLESNSFLCLDSKNKVSDKELESLEPRGYHSRLSFWACSLLLLLLCTKSILPHWDKVNLDIVSWPPPGPPRNKGSWHNLGSLSLCNSPFDIGANF